MTIFKKIPFFSLVVIFSFALFGCGNNQASNETSNFIKKVKAETKSNKKANTIEFKSLEKSPIEDIAAIKKRNPFVLQSLLTEAASGSQQVGNLSLLGIFHIKKKKWAIIHAGKQTYRVVAGDKIGNLYTIRKITKNSVTIIRDDGESQETFTLKLQEQK